MTRQRLGTERRREQIAEAALDLVRSSGIRSLSVAAVAGKVGIVPSAVYRHFRSKSHIVEAVLELVQKRLRSHFQETVDQDIGAIEKLQVLLERHVELIAANNAIPRTIFSAEVLGGAPERQRQLYGVIETVIADISAIVSEGQRDGTIRDDIPAETVAVSFLGMIQPAAIIWNLSEGRFDLVRHSREAWRLFAASIRTKNREDAPHP